MNLDPYIFFTECHRLYTRGVRRALRERLTSAFGEDCWWKEGVEHSLAPEQIKSLHIEIERNPDREHHLLLDDRHFGWIIAKHHNEIFSDAFADAVRTFKQFRGLASLRNDWAHVQDISLARSRQAAELMKHILASLRCEEALEVERMSQDPVFSSGNEVAEDLIEELGHQDGGLDSHNPAIAPLGFWHQLQSYLIMEKSVGLPEGQPDSEARVVTIRVHNTAPDSRDWPAVHFESVSVRSTSDLSGRQHDKYLGHLPPGETREAEFTFHSKQLLTVQFEILGKIDADKLWHFQRTTELPDEVTSPLRQEFVNQLESIGIKEFINGVLDTIDEPDPNMTLADIARLRESVKRQSGHIPEKLTALRELYSEFRLDQQSTLGSRATEVALTLTEFGEKLDALDDAISHTDISMMNEAIQNLKQVQLAILRLEDSIRTNDKY